MTAGRILVVGSGKMGADVGFNLLRNGWAVTWASRDPGRLADLERRISRRARRIEGPRQEARFAIVGPDPLPVVDVVLETIEESVEAKRAVIEAVTRRSVGRPPILSNSSSILPSEIHPECAGLHFFYPVEITGIAEAVMPGSPRAGTPELMRSMASSCGVDLLVQDEAAAFTVNRLVLPVQAECARMLLEGGAADAIDAATRSDLAGIGALSLMDAAGLDVVLPAAGNYLSRMGEAEASCHAPLVECLGAMVGSGKLGSKNGDGFLAGRPLPWPRSAPRECEPAAFRLLLINSCARALARGAIGTGEVDLVLSSLHGATTTLAAAIEAQGREAIAGSLGDLYRRTGLCYFSPARVFAGGAE